MTGGLLIHSFSTLCKNFHVNGLIADRLSLGMQNQVNDVRLVIRPTQHPWCFRSGEPEVLVLDYGNGLPWAHVSSSIPPISLVSVK